uniref:Transposase n=1 Tax=Globodera rostochiensis TaxID=31243 RepID=A0A914HQ85_GLORO
MNEFWILILVAFFATNSLDKAESVKVKLEETPLKIIDEIFGEGWWDNDKAEEWHKLTLEQNALHQIDRQNTQIGQIKSNSTDQLGQIEPNSTDQLGQIEPNSTDLNAPLTESDHSEKSKNSEELNEIINEYKSKKEFEKFDQKKVELKRDGFKSSYKKTVAKELGLSFVTIYDWKQKLGQTAPNKHPHSKQMELMKRYYEIKDQTPKIRDEAIAKMLKIGSATLKGWKSQFKRQQLHPNSVDGHFVEEIAGQMSRKLATRIQSE